MSDPAVVLAPEGDVKRLVLLLLLFAVPAHAVPVKRYASPIGSDSLPGATSSNNPCTNSATPCRTCLQITGAANSLDTLIFFPSNGVRQALPGETWGRYVDKLIINHRGIVCIGDTVRPNTTVFKGIELSTSTGTYTDVKMQGFRVNGNVNYISDPQYQNGKNVMFRKVNVLGSTQVVDANVSFYGCTLGVHRDSADSYFRLRVYKGTLNGDGSMNVILRGNRIIMAPLAPFADNDDYLMCFHVEKTETDWMAVDATNNRFEMFKPHNFIPIGKPTFYRGIQHCRFSDNYWTFIDSSGYTGDSGGLLFRDRLTDNIWLRDTFDLATLRAGTGAGRMEIISSGSNQFSYNVGQHNTWRYCLFKSNIPATYPAFDVYYQMQNADSFTRNTVICSTAVNRSGFHVHNVVGNAFVYRNTFVNLGTGGAVMINDDQDVCAGHTNCCWGGTLEFKGNICYSRSTGTGASDYAMKLAIENYSFPSVASDYNLYSHYGAANGTRSVNWAACGATGTNYSPTTLYAATSYLNGGGLDLHSRYGSPLFTDTASFAGFNFTPTIGSRASFLLGDADAGAIDFTDPYRPYMVNDLSATGSTTKTVILSWTETGEDSLTGTALRYDLRTSASAITEGNFSSATQITGVGTPGVSGTRKFFTVTGLSPETAYYFAIKAYDDFGNPSAISNNAFISTQSEGGLGSAEP